MFEQEYETLRQELSDNKKYILERPLLIITAGLVLFDYMDGSDYIMLFPPVFIFLLLFNLIFTKNRLDSSARIVVYIRQFIEKKEPTKYRWETFLNEYRKESKTEDKSENGAKKKSGLRYYPMIYGLHLVAVIFLLLIEAMLFFIESSEPKVQVAGIWLIELFSLLLSLAGLFFLAHFAIKAHPKKVREYYKYEETEVAKTLRKME